MCLSNRFEWRMVQKVAIDVIVILMIFSSRIGKHIMQYCLFLDTIKNSWMEVIVYRAVKQCYYVHDNCHNLTESRYFVAGTPNLPRMIEKVSCTKNFSLCYKNVMRVENIHLWGNSLSHWHLMWIIFYFFRFFLEATILVTLTHSSFKLDSNIFYHSLKNCEFDMFLIAI